jgi:hypothetical protein
MTLAEIEDLLYLRKWSRKELGSRLGLSKNTIDRWFMDTKWHAGPKACETMRQLLNESRQEAIKRWSEGVAATG